MGEREGNSYVRESTCQAIRQGHDREIKDMKRDIEKLDGRIWWIVGTGVLTFIMSGLTLWAQLR
tara:strand:- start:297 stop:488 length:192 start_codon:yes stop_codon:yes gene_type:complete